MLHEYESQVDMLNFRKNGLVPQQEAAVHH